MNNQEINLAIAKLVHPEARKIQPDAIDFCKDGEGVLVSLAYGSASLVDYCNNWNDLMPLVVEHKIALMPEYFDDIVMTDNWEAEYEIIPNGYQCSVNKDPQRALAECLLKVLESKLREGEDD